MMSEALQVPNSLNTIHNPLTWNYSLWTHLCFCYALGEDTQAVLGEQGEVPGKEAKCPVGSGQHIDRVGLEDERAPQEEEDESLHKQ